MRYRNRLFKLLGMWYEEDQREVSPIVMLEACKCPLYDCEKRGEYTECYDDKPVNCKSYQEYGVVE